MSSVIGSGSRSAPALWAPTRNRIPVVGSSLITIWLRLRAGVANPNPRRGGRRNTTRISVCVTGRSLPVRMKNGTPDHRQLSMSRRSAA